MERRVRPLSNSIELSLASLVALVAIGAEVLFQVLVLAFSLPAGVHTWVVVVGNQAVFFLTCFFFTRAKNIDLAELTGVRRVPKLYLFPLFVLIAVLCVLAFAPLAGLFSSLLRTLGYQYTPKYYVPFDNVGLFILALLGLTVLPAIGEETLMRGVLLSGAKRKGAVFAIWFTSLVFALFHGNLTQLVHQFLLGAVMAYLVLLTRSIWASAVLHAVNNATALVVEYLHEGGSMGGDVYGYFTANFSEGLTAGAFIGILSASLCLLAGALALVTYLIKCVRTRAGESVTGWQSLLAEPSETAEKRATDGRFYPYEKYLPAFLVGVLALFVIANVVSEVLK